MPILQIRASQGEQYLSVPAAHQNIEPVLAEWYKEAWRSEMLVYPAGYAGDITPHGWEAHSSYILQVEDNGEQAHMMALGKTQTPEEAAAAIEMVNLFKAMDA